MKTLFKSFIHTVSALSLVTAATAPAFAQSEAQTATGTAAPAAAAPATVDADPALWVVKDKDTTIYLFGTVHVLKPGLTWFDEAVSDAFNKSDELVLEVIEPDMAASQGVIISRAQMPAGQSFRTVLTPEQDAAYVKAITGIGMPEQTFNSFEPWFVALSMGMLPLLANGYDLNSGAEKVLTAKAREKGMKLGELETLDQQMGFFDNLPQDTQVAYLNAVISGIDQVTAQIDGLVNAWGKGDPETLGVLMNGSFSDPVLYDTLLTQRNIRWAEWIDTRLDQPGTVFVAVGAGHLAGKDSVQAKLKKRKIKAKRVKY